MGKKPTANSTSQLGHPVAGSFLTGPEDTSVAQVCESDLLRLNRSRLEQCSAIPGHPDFPRQLKPGEILE